MVGLAYLSTSPPLLSALPISTLYHCPSSSDFRLFNPTFHHFIHQSHKFRGIINTSRTTVRRAKLSSYGEEEEEQLEEAFFGGDEDIEEDDSEDDEETESSLDLFVRFMLSLFKKLSKKAKKATLSILPPVISPQLVSFTVDGVLLLTSLSIIKAFLEVVCTFGSTIFAAILFLRLMWATISHFQSSGNRFDHGGTSYGSPQPVS